MRALLMIILCFSASKILAQKDVLPNKVYGDDAIEDRIPLEWPPLRQADVMWAKRVWRIIDIREKQNQPMQWPKNPLNVILYHAIINGSLTAYRDDSLASSMSANESKLFGSGQEPVKKLIDESVDADDPANVYYDTIQILKSPHDIKKFKIMEDWIFDKRASVLFVRIIAIAPMVPFSVAGQESGETEWAWLKYHKNKHDLDSLDLRMLLVRREVFNRQNMAHPLSYDDWFELRMFSSYIVKESNPYDAAIKEFIDFKDDGVAALIESDRIRQELFELEHDLWEY